MRTAPRERVLSGVDEELGVPDSFNDQIDKASKPGYLRMQNGCFSVTKGLCYLSVGAIVAKSIVELWIIAHLPWSLGN